MGAAFSLEASTPSYTLVSLGENFAYSWAGNGDANWCRDLPKGVVVVKIKRRVPRLLTVMATICGLWEVGAAALRLTSLATMTRSCVWCVWEWRARRTL